MNTLSVRTPPVAVYTPLKFCVGAGHIRLYYGGSDKSFADRESFDCIVTVESCAGGGAWVSGAHGRLSVKAVEDKLKDIGYSFYQYERRGTVVHKPLK